MNQNSRIFNPFWFIVPDLLWMLVSLGLVINLKYGIASTEAVQTHYRIFLPLFAVWLLVMFVHNLFDPKNLRRYTQLFFGFVSAAFFNFIIGVLYFYWQPDLLLTPRRFLLLTLAFWFLLTLAWHLMLKFILQKRISEGYYLFGMQNELDELHQEIISHDYLGFKTLEYLTSLEQLAKLDPANLNLIIPERSLSNPDQVKVVYSLRARGANVVSQVDFYERLLRRVPLDYVDEPWFLRNVWIRSTRLQQFLRRASDILAGLAFGIIFLMTFPVIAAAIKLTSPGPLFFIQPRVGLNGEPFRVYKYRTMSADSSGKGWTRINDPRVTRVGAFLRRTHLDELPQCINLLAGHMSIVGPRPEQIEIVTELAKSLPFYRERHAINPGLTGWAQLNIYAGTLEESKLKLEYDLYYLKHRSVFFDLEIILKTLYSILVNKLR